MEIKKKKHPSATSSGAALQASAESSFRVYYGATGAAVPFKWESQPGTPKHSLFSDASLPPLTPPPSYFSAPSTPSPTPKKKKTKGTAADTKLAVLLHSALPRLVSRTTSPNSHSSSSSSSFSSMYYSPSPSATKDDGGAKGLRRARSALTCFGLTGSVNRSCGYPVSSVKNALFSVVACRRSHSVDYIV